MQADATTQSADHFAAAGEHEVEYTVAEVEERIVAAAVDIEDTTAVAVVGTADHSVGVQGGSSEGARSNSSDEDIAGIHSGLSSHSQEERPAS